VRKSAGELTDCRAGVVGAGWCGGLQREKDSGYYIVPSRSQCASMRGVNVPWTYVGKCGREPYAMRSNIHSDSCKIATVIATSGDVPITTAGLSGLGLLGSRSRGDLVQA
jgi:hypothetical protein